MTAAIDIDAICPAARLAREAAETHKAWVKADAAGDDALADDLLHRLEAIETAATFSRAASALGAFFQALLIFSEADEESVCFHADTGSRRAARRLQRLAASIAGQLEAAADAATVETLRDRYLSREFERSTLGATVLDRAA